jgi:malonate-semialdehyde dehydrogenase (acetylating)/methylmalonate-semialdehyde dehydrogenase
MIVMPDADLDQAVDALMGAAYGSAGERCMAISVAVPIGDQTADALMAKLEPKVRALKIGPGTDPEAEMGPLVTKQHYEKVRGYIDAGEREGAKLVVDGRGFKMQGYENGYFIGGSLFDHVTTDMKIYQEEIFGPVLAVARAPSYEAAAQMINDHEFGNGTAFSPVTATRRASSRIRSRLAWWASMCRSLSRWRFTPSAAGSRHSSAITTCTETRACVFIQSSRQSRRGGQPAYAPARTS